MRTGNVGVCKCGADVHQMTYGDPDDESVATSRKVCLMGHVQTPQDNPQAGSNITRFPPRVAVPKVDREFVFKLHGWQCWICGHPVLNSKTGPGWRDPKMVVLDHIKPLSLGGATEEWNLQCLCNSCNVSKGNKWLPVAIIHGWKIVYRNVRDPAYRYGYGCIPKDLMVSDDVLRERFKLLKANLETAA